MLHAFRTDRTFQQQFTDVWLWMDWPGRAGVDIGVDLVARTPTARLIAIQCKCYDPDGDADQGRHRLVPRDSRARQQFARRIIVATTDLWSANAEKALEGHTVPIERIGIDDLDAMTVDWSSYDVANPSGLKPTERHVLRAHQVKAVDAVRAGLREQRPGQADHGVRHRQDLHRPAHRRGARRRRQVGAVPGPVDRAGRPVAQGVDGGVRGADPAVRGVLGRHGGQADRRRERHPVRPRGPADHRRRGARRGGSGTICPATR